jgi:uncharacterized protein (UPF0335 family)
LALLKKFEKANYFKSTIKTTLKNKNQKTSNKKYDTKIVQKRKIDFRKRKKNEINKNG